MHIDEMSHATNARTGVTVRLTPDAHDRLRRIADLEHRSVASYLELLVDRELAARDAAERVVRVHVAPELADVPQGAVRREDGESDARYVRRRTTLTKLFGEP
jgi:plasmid stabilization system protein ParE